MGFWGIEVKPAKPHPYHSDNVQGRLRITQATLGHGSSTEKSILQCSVGDKSPIYLCSLLPNKNECCSLDLEFDEEDLVAFSVIGPRSIHLCGYFVAEGEDHLHDEYNSDSYGEDIAETESDESSEFDTEDEYDDDFIDDSDDEMYPSPVPNSGVVIEEIEDDHDNNPVNDKGQQKKKLKKKDKSSNSEKQIVLKSSASVPVLESEDEDGFPISTSGKSDEPQLDVGKEVDKTAKDDIEKEKENNNEDHDAGKKRKVKTVDQDDQPERKKKKKQKVKSKKRQVNEAPSSNEAGGVLDDEDQSQKNQNTNEKSIDNDGNNVSSESQPKKKKKNKKKKAKESEEQTKDASADKNGSASSPEQIQGSSKSSQVRTYPNGLVVEEVAMGKPDGKKAAPGKKVSVRYIGKLKKNGKIFDSNVGRAPFKFILGIGNVIKGWDVGVNGMRVGDKRRLTIPPSMGYGAKGAGGQIPPNAWLVFDVELIDVR